MGLYVQNETISKIFNRILLQSIRKLRYELRGSIFFFFVRKILLIWSIFRELPSKRRYKKYQIISLFSYPAKSFAKYLEWIASAPKVNEAGRKVNEGGYLFTDIWMYLVNRRNSDSSLPTRSPWTFVVTSIENSFCSSGLAAESSHFRRATTSCVDCCSLIIEQIRNEIETERDA